jgi:glucan phosphoethanolaminetransferase (alkaline phosphatase superfamily)
MIETKDVVIAIFGATTAASALVLVFFGIVATSLWSDSDLSNYWRQQFKLAGGVSSAAFFLSLVCAGLCTWWLTLHQPCRVYLALVAAFLLELVLIGLAGALVLFRTIFR